MLAIERDYNGVFPTLRDMVANDQIVMPYYGDISNLFLPTARKPPDRPYDVQADIADRETCLATLGRLTKQELTSEAYYKSLYRRHTWRDDFASAISPSLAWLRLSDNLIRRRLPDIGEYWNPDSKYGSKVRWPLTEVLRRLLLEKSDILLVTHSLGTMIAYDVLWKLSYYGEHRAVAQLGHKVSLWITLGSPLGDRTVRKNLKGSRARKSRRFPSLVHSWTNVAARNDYVCHDRTLQDDFREMPGLTRPIQDKVIWNMAKRYGESNPHHGVGYLVSPCVADAVATWLRT